MGKMTSLRRLSTACLCLAVAFAQAAIAQTSARPARPGSVVHVRITGDLECMQAARDLTTALGEAHRDRGALVILELGANHSRLDVIAAMVRAIIDSNVPVVVYLRDSDGVAGAGALCLGIAASECILAPGTAIKGRAAGIAQGELAPDTTSWGTEIEDLAAVLRPRAQARELCDGLESVLISPAQEAWTLSADGACTIVMDRPSAPGAVQVIVQEQDQCSVSLDAGTAVQLKLASTTLDNWTMIPLRRDHKHAPRVQRTIAAGVALQAMKAETLLEAAEKAHDAAASALKLPWPAAKDLSHARYHEAASEGRASITAADAALAQLEALLTKYPEVTRRPAPGQTSVGGKPSTYTSKWRSMVQSRRDKLRKLEATADKFARL